MGTRFSRLVDSEVPLAATNVVRPIRSVCVVSGTRAEYGLLKPVLEAIQGAGLRLHLIVAGMHLAPEFGDTFRVIERDGFRIDARIDMTLAGDTNAAMAKSIGIGIYGMSQAIESIDPDVVFVPSDRVEGFAGAVSGAALGKLVAHVHGGERSRGGLDESMRHAITKLAHLHFAATEQSRERVIRMGERPDLVYTVGAPALDVISSTKLAARAELEQSLGFPLQQTFILMVQHSVSTQAEEAEFQAEQTIQALKDFRVQTIVLYPNSDAGGRAIIKVIRKYGSEPWLHSFPSLDHATYLSLLEKAALLVGNSSSGIIEAPSFHLPVVNIGIRQQGRERSTNVLDVEHDKSAISKALRYALTDEQFKRTAGSCVNPYGDGRAARRIAEVLSRTQMSPEIIQKQITY
jgi:UDP-N-acetylglucosamine 2-epimerase (non-hydrolysing)/GDP/UDP-N,N'-diacetylbacillosamine 2-epimerase (hydrolysing)